MLEDLSCAARESGNLKGDKMADGGVSHAEAAGAVLRYESFLNDVLKRDLALVQARREREEEALEAYEKLKGEAARFEAMAKGEGKLVRTLVDVGCEVYAQAELDIEVRWPFH